jgi:hypothetical protein
MVIGVWTASIEALAVGVGKCYAKGAEGEAPHHTPDTMATLTKADITIGTKLIKTAHPEYGIWYVTDIDLEWFDLRGRSGDIFVFYLELKFWQLA